MTVVYQAVGAVAIALGLGGTWLVARHSVGWLVCIVSSALWLPTLVVGSQWVAVGNVALSIALCVRNFRAQRSMRRAEGAASDLAAWEDELRQRPSDSLTST